MTKIGKFKIEGSFKLTGRGTVAFGQIAEGMVKIGSHFALNIGGQPVAVQITGVEMMDEISTQESWVGLLFNFTDEQQHKEFDRIELEQQVVEIFQ